MKKYTLRIGVMFMLVLTAALVLVGCGKKGTEIAILVPDATHGWPVGVVYYARESAKELEKDYVVKVIVSKDSAQQTNQIEDLLTEKTLKGVVILPFDNDVKNAVQKIADKKIPFVMFDRIIDGVPSNANVQGDNRGIGYETAKVMVQKGLKPGAKVLEMPGDNSSVPGMRSDGFREYLKDEAGWTDAQIATIDKTDFTGWNRETSRTLFSAWLGSKTPAQLLEYEYIFTHDDEIALGVLDEIKSTDKDLTHLKVLASSAGKKDYYDMLDKEPTDIYSKLGEAYLFSVTYPPKMIQDSVQALVDILNGKTVQKEIVIPVEIVDHSNAKDYYNPDSPY